MTCASAPPSTTGPSADDRRSYRELVHELWGDLGIWDYLHYDDEGYLWINGLRVIDTVARYGTPLEIVDTTIVQRRSDEFRRLSRSAAHECGYPGHLEYFYAAKANMASETAHAAYRAGWHAETSSAQDLAHLRWLGKKGLLPTELKIVCNGFKLPPHLRVRASAGLPSAASTVLLPDDTLTKRLREPTYAEQIVSMARDGWDISPILDTGELEYFGAPGTPSLKVGMRLKAGRVHSLDELDRLPGRFGMDRHQLAATARQMATIEHLELTSLHAMIGAAESIPIPVFVESMLVCARVWADLRRRHESLTELNLGGGIPPLAEKYDHRELLETLFAGFMRVSRDAGVPPPDVTFELGSLVAAEAGFHVFGVLQLKQSFPDWGASDSSSIPPSEPWAIVDGGLMAAIPDMLIIDKRFRFLAARGADRPAREVRLGDPTCDPDGRYPPESFDDEVVLLPESDGPQQVVVLGVGAYQEILAGVRGAHHCGLLEAIELIIEPRPDGGTAARIMPRQTWRDAAGVLGYTDAAAESLLAAMPDGNDRE